MPLSRITSPFMSATANVYSPSANTIAIKTTGSDRVIVDSNGGVGLNSPVSSEWASSGIFQVNNSATYSTLSLATTRTVADGNRIGSIVWEMPNNTATYRSRAELECDMKGSTTGKFGAQVRINVAPDNTSGMTNSAIFNQYGIGLNTTPSSGTGIAFPASQNASSDPNTLDDYEEGTWTPTLTGSSVWPTVSSYNNQYGHYRKIGSLVFVSFYIYITSGKVSGGSGDTQISGLPFNALGSSASAYSTISTGYAYINGTASGQGGTGPIRWQINANNGNYLTFYGDRNGVWGTGMYELSGTGCYMVYQ